MAHLTETSERWRQHGAIYLLVLFFIAMTGAALAALGRSWSNDAKREREVELLWAGSAYRRAIARYYEATPGPLKSFPASLEGLLADPRFPDTQRHLRQLIPDPMTGKVDWILIPAPMGGIMGVASRSDDEPLKRSGFERPNLAFEELAIRLKDQVRYRDWEFIHNPGYAIE